MMLYTAPLGEQTLPRNVLEKDRRECRKIGPCGLGREALYVGSRFLSRIWYIRWREVRRVFKRVAMSAGGYTGRGAFGTMAYLVVQYGDGREKSCYFRREPELDTLLGQIHAEHPQIPVHSEAAERKLAEAKAEESRRFVKKLSPEAEETAGILRRAKELLEARPELSRNLSAAAKQKRIVDQMPMSARIIGASVGFLGLAAALWGLLGLMNRTPNSLYFLIGGAIAFFAVYTASLFPSKWNSRKYAQTLWDTAVEECRQAAAGWEHFPVPPQYSHSTVLERMIRVVREGRAGSTEAALEAVKADLKSLNAGVTVSQQEHDEVAEIKPMFLVCDYRD